jgi:hypothetical protein
MLRMTISSVDVLCLLGILAAQNFQSRCAEEQSACEQSDFSPNFFMISFLVIQVTVYVC